MFGGSAMSILNSEVIQAIVDKLSQNIRKNKFSSGILPKFVFICGKQILNEMGIVKSKEELESEKNKRQLLIDKLHNNNVICIISEKIYNSDAKIDSLTFEELLAELSDDIIIIVESYGTVCELGAFTVNEKYFRKLLVINNEQFRNKKSFINEGPIRKLLAENEDRYILTKYDYEVFKSNFQINDYIKEIKGKNIYITPNNYSHKLELKNLIYELLNIIEIFQPITKYEIMYIYKRVKGFREYNIEGRDKHGVNSPSSIFKLMKSMDLIDINEDYISKTGNYTCYNSLFNIKKENFDKLRVQIVYEMKNICPDRFREDQNEDITINE